MARAQQRSKRRRWGRRRSRRRFGRRRRSWSLLNRKGNVFI